jgi:PAS domain S-box-containing protein
MFKRISLSSLLTIGLVVGLFCMLTISSLAIWQQYKILINTQAIYEHPLAVTNDVRDIRVYTRGIWELTHKAAYHSEKWDEEVARKTTELEARIDDKLAEVEKKFTGNKSEINDIKNDFTEQKRLSHASYELLRAGETKKAVAFLEAQNVDTKYENLSKNVNDVLAFSQVKAKELTDDAALQAQNGLKLLLILSLSFLIFGAIAAFIIIRYLQSEFGSLHAFAENIQFDELDKITVDESDKSEFAKLKHAMNMMVDGLIEARQTADEAYETLTEQAAHLEEQATELEEQTQELEGQSKALQTAETMYRTLFEQSRDGILLVDTTTQYFAEFNKAAYENLGYTAEEFAKLTIKDLEVNESPEEIAQHLQIMKSQGWDEFESQHRRKDGGVQDVQVVANIVMMDGRPMLQTSLRDITVKKTQEKSELENTLLRKTLLDNSAVAIFLASPDRKIVQANKRSCEIFGYDQSEIESSSFRLIHISDESFEAFAPEYKRLSGEGITNIEYPFARKDGTVFWGSVSGTALDPNDLSKGVIWTLLDVDEKVSAQDAIKELNSELEQKVAQGIEDLRQKDQILAQQAKMAAMGEMIGNIAHQWRQPLNTLMAAKDLLILDYSDNILTQASMEEYSDQTTRTLKYLSATIDDFRNFFVTSKKKESFDIISAIKKALSIASSSLSYSSIETNFTPKIEHINAFGFQNEFQQVTINILNNAKDAIVANKKSGSVNIEVDASENFVAIHISNNGGNIPEEVLEKIFDPYFTTKFKSQGTGLGLYMAKTIIESNMNGKISAANDENGVVFTILLPTKEDENVR